MVVLIPSDDVIEYITMASEGNTIDFGDLTYQRHAGSASSSTHGLIMVDIHLHN